MKLQARLGWGASAIIACTLASTLTAHMRMLHIIHVAQGVNHEGWPLVDSLSQLHIDVAESITTTQQAVLDAQSGSSAHRSSVLADEDTAIEADVKHIYEFSSGADSGANLATINGLLGQVQELRRLEGQITGSITQQGPSAAASASAMLQTQLLPATNAFVSGLNQAVDTERRIEQDKVLALYSADESVILILWLASICATIATVVTTVLLGRHLLSAIRLTSARARAIAAGDLTGAPMVTASNDELGELTSTIQLMQDHLAKLIGTVADTAGTLTGNAASMRMASDQIHRRVDQQSQQTRQAATAMQEMSASIAEVSRHTQSAAETARNAAHTAREGGTIVRQMLDTMHSIAEAVTETSTTVGVLGDDSKRISQIVTVIDEIARKTNLLALNAAIEAARAGEQGRGFAVVAGEVRRLAESTAQATSEIGAMIRGIQDRTRSAIASMESGTGTVKQGVETTNQAGEALERIIGMADTVDRMITQIAIAAQQQAAASDQSAASLESIHTLSQENLSAMSTTAVGVESLRETAMSLESQVDRFRVTGGKVKMMKRTGPATAGSFASSLA